MTSLLALIAFSPSVQVRVDGDGWMRFSHEGHVVYARSASLSPSHGVLATPKGAVLLPQIHVPEDVTSLSVGLDGTVSVNGRKLTRMVLISFPSGSATKLKDGFYTNGVKGQIGMPGDDVFGVIRASGNSTDEVAANPEKSGHAEKAPSETPSHEATNTVHIHLHSELVGSSIRIKDIARIDVSDSDLAKSIGDVDLGESPVFGSVRGLSRSYIVARLKNQGIDTKQFEVECPLGAVVERKSQTVSESALLEASQKVVLARLGLAGEYRLAQSAAGLKVPLGELSFDGEADSTPNGAMVNLAIKVDGEEVARRTISLVGKQTSVDLKIGDTIKLRLIRSGATVEVDAKVRTPGAVGSKVTVVTTDGGAEFTGILKEGGYVEVKL